MGTLVNSLESLIKDLRESLPLVEGKGYDGIRVDLSKLIVPELTRALEFYAEPRFSGWPKSLIEQYINEDKVIPPKVLESYLESINSNPDK